MQVRHQLRASSTGQGIGRAPAVALRIGAPRSPFKAPSHRAAWRLPRVAAQAVAVQPNVALGNDVTQAPASQPDAEKLPEVPYNWFRFWWPVAPIGQMDKDRPISHVLLGREYVVWYNKLEDKWSVMQDLCPHRFAPLSQGRIMGGELQCSYHGWRFNSAGQCTAVPQLPESEQKAACENSLSCAKSYPTMIREGVLFFWPDASPEGVEASKRQGVARVETSSPSPGWFMNGIAADFASMLEQGMDPTHANFLHHNTGFDMEQVKPMQVVTWPEPDKDVGLMMEHTAFENRNSELHAHRFFIPPYNTVLVYRQPKSTTVMHFMIVPTVPSQCRAFGKISIIPGPPADMKVVRNTADDSSAVLLRAADLPNAGKQAQGAGAGGKEQNGSPLPLPLRLGVQFFNRLPHWVISSAVGDQDAMVVGSQERFMARKGLTGRNYHILANNADAGVVALNKWMRQVRYPASMYPPGMQHPGLSDPPGGVPPERLLDRYENHVKHCVVCQKGMVLVTRVCVALAAAAVLSGMFALTTAAAGLVLRGSVLAGGWPAAVAAVGAGALAWLACQMWAFRENRFITGAPAWRRAGGVSLVKMPDL